MKKVIFILGVAVLFSASQVEAQKGFSVNVKAAPQLTFLVNSDDNDNRQYDRKATFNAGFGLGAGYNFTYRSGIGLDVLYSRQGQRYTFNGTDYNQKANYVKIPLLYIYNSNPSKQISFIGKIGPQLSIITGSKLTDDDGNDLIGDNKAAYKSTTFGGVALAGVQFRLNSKTFLNTALRFDHDFTNAEDDSYPGYNKGRANTYNSTAGLEVGIKFLLD